MKRPTLFALTVIASILLLALSVPLLVNYEPCNEGEDLVTDEDSCVDMWDTWTNPEWPHFERQCDMVCVRTD